MTIPATDLRRLFLAVLVTAFGVFVAIPALAQDAEPSGLPSAEILASPEPSARASSAPVPVIEPEGTWDVISFDTRGDGLVEPLRGSTLTVSLLPDGRLEGNTACGAYIGGYWTEGDVIRLDVISTGWNPCGKRREAEAFDFTEALDAATAWAPTEGALALIDETGVTRVLLARPEHTGVVGDWTVGLFARPNGKLIEPLPGTELTISFDADGQATGSVGCRRFEAAYSLEAGRIAIEPLKMVGLPCDGPDRRQERQYRLALESSLAWTRGDGRLELLDPTGGLLVELSGRGSG